MSLTSSALELRHSAEVLSAWKDSGRTTVSGRLAIFLPQPQAFPEYSVRIPRVRRDSHRKTIGLSCNSPQSDLREPIQSAKPPAIPTNVSTQYIQSPAITKSTRFRSKPQIKHRITTDYRVPTAPNRLQRADLKTWVPPPPNSHMKATSQKARVKPSLENSENIPFLLQERKSKKLWLYRVRSHRKYSNR